MDSLEGLMMMQLSIEVRTTIFSLRLRQGLISDGVKPWSTKPCLSFSNKLRLACFKLYKLFFNVLEPWLVTCLPFMRWQYPWVVPSKLGWEIRSEFRGIPQLFRFWTFWTPEFSSEFYFSDRKMYSRQFWTRFFRFGILSRHQLFRFHESENVPAINVSGKWHQIWIFSMHQLFSRAPLPSHCSWYLLDTHKN